MILWTYGYSACSFWEPCRPGDQCLLIKALLNLFPARMHLWAAGLDYLHGTGHGVGSFLNVHEGPCGISPRVSAVEIALEEGMILSDEPG